MVTMMSTPSFHLSMLSLPTTPSTYNLTSSSFNKIPLFRLRTQTKPDLGHVQKLAIRCGVTQIDQTRFSETVLKSDVPVLVEFIADWCGPCRLIAPAIEWASQEYQDRIKVVKIDHDSNPQLIEEYKVYGLPALIVFNKGQQLRESRREGAMSKVKLKAYLDAVLDSIAVA